jgi:hypothetical protein
MHRALPLALAIASTAFVIPLRADAGDGVDVTWSAPDECPSSVELRRRVTARVPGDASVRARGRVEKRAGRYRLALDIATASMRGERAIEASTCDALASSAAVVIAMSVAAPEAARDGEAAAATTTSTATSAVTPPGTPTSDKTADATPAAAAASAPPTRASPSSPSSPSSPTSPTSPSSPTSSVATSSPDRANEGDARRASEPPSRFLVRAHVVGDAGLLPSAAAGGGLAFGVTVARDLTVEANADLFASQDGTVAGTPGRGASFSLVSAGVRACYTLTHGIEVAPCLGAEIARISASGFGAVQVSDAAALTWGPEGLLAGRIPIAGPVSVRVGIGAFVPMSRQSFVINAAGTVHKPEAIALRTWAGPEVRF